MKKVTVVLAVFLVVLTGCYTKTDVLELIRSESQQTHMLITPKQDLKDVTVTLEFVYRVRTEDVEMFGDLGSVKRFGEDKDGFYVDVLYGTRSVDFKELKKGEGYVVIYEADELLYVPRSEGGLIIMPLIKIIDARGAIV